MKEHVEHISAVGHENVHALHESTLEITTDDWLTPAGDCIIGVAANRAPATFDTQFVQTAQSSNARIVLDLETAGLSERITGQGDPRLTFSSERSAVLRTSTYVDDRTVMIGADRAAADIDRDFVCRLRAGEHLTAHFRTFRRET